MKNARPNFLIIGSAKCGTTALASILDSHPDCCMSRPKEVSYFQDTVDFKPNQNYQKGWSWYKSAFEHFNGEPLIGEATPSYSDRSRSPSTAKRVFEFNPGMKIVYMVRNPLERQISAWKMQYAFGMDKSTPSKIEEQWALDGFTDWMERQRGVNQWDTVCYYFQLKAYLEYFPKSQVAVSYLEDWKINQEKEIVRLFSFLGLDYNRYDKTKKEQRNASTERKIQRNSMRLLLQNGPVKCLIPLVPKVVREALKEKLLHKSIKVPPAIIGEDLLSDFLDYVEHDSMELHRFTGKPENFWKTG